MRGQRHASRIEVDASDVESALDASITRASRARGVPGHLRAPAPADPS